MSRVSLQDILNGIAARSGVKKTEVQQFLKTLQQVIEEGLEADSLVKINGLGTFKLVWNEPRKSVNVQTGESIELPGHNKLTFIPENGVKDRINAPLAHLEVITLGENNEELPAVESTEDPLLERLSQQAVALQSIIESIQEVSPEKEETSELPEVEEKVATVTPEPQPIVEEFPMEPEKEVEQQPNEEVTQTIQPEEPLQTPPTPPIPPKESIPETTTSTPISGKDIIQKSSSEKKGKKPVWPWILVVCVLLILVAVFMLFWTYKDSVNSPLVIEEPVLVTDSIVAETPNNIGDSTEFVEEQSIEEDNDIYHAERHYTEFIDTTVLTNGSRLTYLALKYYGHRNYWVYIYEANKDLIVDPNKIPVGTKLLIPKLDSRLLDPCNTQSVDYAKELGDKYLSK